MQALIGGFSLAVDWTWPDVEHIFVEIDPFCQKVLRKHWPESEMHSDIKKYHPKRTVDLVTGGFPCQPFSVAGKQQSKADDRYLWSEMLRVIQEVRPTWIVAENVTGIINLALDEVLASLESSGYKTETFIIPACGVDAPHRRDRVWIVANASNGRWGKLFQQKQITKCNQQANIGGDGEIQFMANASDTRIKGMRQREISTNKNVADTDCEGLSQPTCTSIGIVQKQNGTSTRSEFSREVTKTERKRSTKSGLGQLVDGVSPWLVEPDIPRVATGVDNRVNKLRALGNAVVPQVAATIMQAIRDTEETLA